MEMNPKKEKPRIRQAGSAEAFLDSTATGREHPYNRQLCEIFQHFLFFLTDSRSTRYVIFKSFFAIIPKNGEKFPRLFFGILFPNLGISISAHFRSTYS